MTPRGKELFGPITYGIKKKKFVSSFSGILQACQIATMLKFLNNLYLDSLKYNSLSLILNFRLLNFSSFLAKKASSTMSILCLQLSTLVNKDIVVFSRSFFLELFFKNWLIFAVPLTVVFFFLYKVTMQYIYTSELFSIFFKLNFFFFLLNFFSF